MSYEIPPSKRIGTVKYASDFDKLIILPHIKRLAKIALGLEGTLKYGDVRKDGIEKVSTYLLEALINDSISHPENSPIEVETDGKVRKITYYKNTEKAIRARIDEIILKTNMLGTVKGFDENPNPEILENMYAQYLNKIQAVVKEKKDKKEGKEKKAEIKKEVAKNIASQERGARDVEENLWENQRRKEIQKIENFDLSQKDFPEFSDQDLKDYEEAVQHPAHKKFDTNSNHIRKVLEALKINDYVTVLGEKERVDKVLDKKLREERAEREEERKKGNRYD